MIRTSAGVMSHFDYQNIKSYQDNGVTIGLRWACIWPVHSPCFCTYAQVQNKNLNMADALDRCPHGLGFSMDIVMTVFAILRIPQRKVFIQTMNQSDFGTLTNGKWNGIIGGIMNGVYDTSVPEFTPTEHRLQAVDFSDPVLRARVSYTTKKPSPGGVQVSPLSVLTMSFWLCLIVTGFLVAIFLVIESTEHIRKPWATIHQITMRAMESVLLFAGFSITMSCYPPKSRLISSRQIVAFWGLAAAIIAGLYSGAILVKIVQPQSKVPFHDIRSLAECVERRKCYILMPGKVGALYLRLTLAQGLSSEEMELHHAIKKNPVRFAHQQQLSKHIFSSKHDEFPVLLSTRVQSDIIRSNDKTHRYHVVDGDFSDRWCFPTRKKSNLTKLISIAVSKASQVGLIQAVYWKYLNTSRGSKVRESNLGQQVSKPLNIYMLSGTLIILGIGVILALTLFLLENLCFIFQQIHGNNGGHETQSLKQVGEFEHWMEMCENKWDEVRHGFFTAAEGRKQDVKKLCQLYNHLDASLAWLNDDTVVS